MWLADLDEFDDNSTRDEFNSFQKLTEENFTRIKTQLTEDKSVFEDKIVKINEIGTELPNFETSLSELIARKKQELLGLSDEKIRNFPRVNPLDAGVPEKCCTCLEDITTETIVLRLDCAHHVCESCAFKWFRSWNTCPKCRRQFQ